MSDIILQAFVFFVIAANFIVLVVAAVRPWLMEAFRKHPQPQAVIIPFARPSHRRGRHD